MDFAKHIADPSIVDDVVANGPKFFKPQKAEDFFMPFEYSAAAYRFGHSMVRSSYEFNLKIDGSPEAAPHDRLAVRNLLWLFVGPSNWTSGCPGHGAYSTFWAGACSGGWANAGRRLKRARLRFAHAALVLHFGGGRCVRRRAIGTGRK
ncbi:MAG: hypothetical protein ABL871_05150 [Terricaulis sp.]